MSVVKRGDTIIEVIIAITIFCLVSIISITLMNSGMGTAEGSLELIMARNEINAQAEALRFIHSSYIVERDLPETQQQYAPLWSHITKPQSTGGLAIAASDLPSFDLNSCDEAYGSHEKFFIINTRQIIDPTDASSNANSVIDSDSDLLTPAPLYPRLVFSEEETLLELNPSVIGAEGIWINAVISDASNVASGQPEFFDFYIRSCWYKPGENYPSTIDTIIRLYNPEFTQ